MIVFIPHPTDHTKFLIKGAFMVREKARSIPGSVFEKNIPLPGGGRGAYAVPLVNLDEAKNILAGHDVRMPPGVEETFKQQLAEASQRIQIKNQETSLVAIPGLKAPNGWQLRDYQRVGVEFLTTCKVNEGGVAAWDVGLGKSLGALASFLKLFNERRLQRGLIVCPAPLKYTTWEKEISQWTDLSMIIIDGDIPDEVDFGLTDEWTWALDENGKRAFHTVDGKKQYQKVTTGRKVPDIRRINGRKLREVQYAQDDRTLVVMNYELFLPDHEFIKQALGIDQTWGVILDESHRVKNDVTSSKRLYQVCAGAGWKAVLTANPLENNIEELYHQVNFIRPGMLGTWAQYKERYVQTDYFGRSTGQPNLKTLAELKARLEPLMMRRTKAEIKGLPELIKQDRWVDYTPAQAKLYDQIVEGILESWAAEESEEGGKVSYLSVMAQITRLQQVCDTTEIFQRVLGEEVPVYINPDKPDLGFKTNRKGAIVTEIIRDMSIPAESAKLNELWNVLEDIHLPHHKAVIFSQYREVTDIVVREVQARYPHINFVYIRGGLKSLEIKERVEQFQKDKRTRIAIITTAANYGVELFDLSGTSDGEYVICLDQHFNPQKMNQIYGRVHRSGVKNTVNVINLLCRDGFEEAKMKLLESKRAVFDAVVEDGEVSEAAFNKLITLEELKSLIVPRKASEGVKEDDQGRKLKKALGARHEYDQPDPVAEALNPGIQV